MLVYRRMPLMEGNQRYSDERRITIKELECYPCQVCGKLSESLKEFKRHELECLANCSSFEAENPERADETSVVMNNPSTSTRSDMEQIVLNSTKDVQVQTESTLEQRDEMRPSIGVNENDEMSMTAEIDDETLSKPDSTVEKQSTKRRKIDEREGFNGIETRSVSAPSASAIASNDNQNTPRTNAAGSEKVLNLKIFPNLRYEDVKKIKESNLPSDFPGRFSNMACDIYVTNIYNGTTNKRNKRELIENFLMARYRIEKVVYLDILHFLKIMYTICRKGGLLI
ncbi:unnamed protein product [Caenorhabditis bovis]|uniref:Uncharacterized protein n=1 Tax=Caenorhabditis bovis TaxID=2654633 RepID=A0A8S1F6E5_9PELO|nr:unnamed protein product [Caenorhabditis bovis]